MASQSSGDVEILVHVTAPSRVADDAAYRRLAKAYLSFAPGSRTLVTIPSSPEIHQRHQQPPPSRQCQLDEGDDFGEAVLQSFCSDSQELSFKEALDNRSSPCLLAAQPRRPVTPRPPPEQVVLPDDNVTTPTAAVCQLPSQISDSYPMPDCDMFNITPTRVLQRYMGGRQPTPTPTAPPLLSSPTLSSVGEPDNLKTEVPATVIGISSSDPLSNPSGTQGNREQRQPTIPATPLISESSRKRRAVRNDDIHDTSALDVTHISSSISGSSASPVAALPRAETDPLPSKRPRQVAQDSGAGTVHPLRSASDNTNQPHRHRRARFSSSPLPHDVLSQIPSTHLSPRSSSFSSSLSARPASPPVSVDRLDLSSLVSAKLGKLAHDLGSRYRPTLRRAAGPLAPLERGHWSVDCRTWPPAQRADAWAFLAGYVRSGLAGWGVWCRRSADGRHIKLYGWAHVAKHTYLLLYLASGRHIKTTGAQWIDADGAVAMEVLP
ncbi:hypothetical protein ISF_04273 [Cordyceps fumosorosea ARSEF 2679]|uniref:Uncharacterized protein n=1 Tax=Cordyceps fumosorosea (strain ARSEF 2679) TaxID=1081104 RepID=A0A167XDZ1_CORFA|nr:hypothetical protein ISF_04273 [Cordyceps fumosorosea ARSEF 2679]OAA64863.1 hypothetical protein ISF_04273 [Cordyceps fumosorosea ARSEF 2679]